MWRVTLSVLAVIYNGLFLILMLLAIVGSTMVTDTKPKPPVYISVSPPNADETRMNTLLACSVLFAGGVLNLLAIGFGARLRRKTPTSPADVGNVFG
jgi:hypothetical protein